MTASNFSEIMKEEANKLVGKTKEEPPVLSTEDQEIKQPEDRRKEGRQVRERGGGGGGREGESRVYRDEQNCEKEEQTNVTKERNGSC